MSPIANLILNPFSSTIDVEICIRLVVDNYLSNSLDWCNDIISYDIIYMYIYMSSSYKANGKKKTQKKNFVDIIDTKMTACDY